ncbi:MAG: acyltransferase [Bacteroidaceae bacterium]|nr:acyltransferase [Bacteroidaceae bacterium]
MKIENTNTPQQSSAMSPYFSDKLKVVSFFAIIMVLYMHAGYPEDTGVDMTIPMFVRNCIPETFGYCAVPMFYAISGYLFFQNVESIGNVFRKMKKRVRTVLVPFVIAAVLFPLFFVVLEHIPGASAYINSKSYTEMFVTQPLWDILVALFYNCGNGFPCAFHLWFLADLIVIIFLSPLIFYLRKYAKSWSVGVMVLLFFLLPNVKFIYALYWFVTGSVVLDKLDRIPRSIVLLMFAAFVGIAVFRQVGDVRYWDFHRIAEHTLGVFSMWCIYDYLVSKDFRLKNSAALSLACQFTFFLYLYHEPMFNIIVKVIPMVLGKNWFGYTMSFLVSPFVFAPIGICVGIFLRRYAGGIYKILVGGR